MIHFMLSGTKLFFFYAVLCLAVFTVPGVNNLQAASKSSVPSLPGSAPNGMNIILGKAEMVRIDGAVADVLVADPSIVDVMAIKSDRLYIVGSNLGDTNIMALDESGNILKKINVHVQIDTDRITAMLRELYPDENINVKAITNQVVLTGEVSTPAIANKVLSLVGSYAGEVQGLDGEFDKIIVNMLGVQGDQQVMLRVKIVEVARNVLKDLGIGLDGIGAGSADGLNASFVTADDLALSSPVQFANAVLGYTSGDLGALDIDISALEQEGIINTLAEPNLTAISGEQAGFLAGGEFPIPTQIDEQGNLVYEFRPFGVSLNFRPTILSKDRINLQLSTEVSSATFERNLQLNGINVPTFNVRRAETTVELPSGGTLMIAGLIRSDSISGLSGVPGVSDVPVVGELLESDTFQRNETELLVMITPYTVKPFAESRAVSANDTIPTATPAYYPADVPPRERSSSLRRQNESEVPRGPVPANVPRDIESYPLRLKDLADMPIDPVSLGDGPVASSSIIIDKPPIPKEKIVRQENRARDVFKNNLEQNLGGELPDTLRELQGGGYVLQ